MTAPDVLTVGRICVDLYPEQHGVGLADVRTFRKSLGGSPANVAVQAARLGSSAAILTKVGDDPFGGYLRGALRSFGVDAGLVGTAPELLTPITFCEVHPPDRFPIFFYRRPSAPDLQLEVDDVDADTLRGARVLWTTGTGLSAEPSRSTTLELLAARAGSASRGSSRAITVHDLDDRPVLWERPEDAGPLARKALAHATVAVGNRDEVEMAVGTRDPAEAAGRLLDLGVELAVVKRGEEGVYARTRAAEVEVAPLRVKVVNGLGAGDAFGGALAHGLARGEELEPMLRTANAAGAIASSRLACADDYGFADEIRAAALGATAAQEAAR